jgi:hypothetical protein
MIMEEAPMKTGRRGKSPEAPKENDSAKIAELEAKLAKVERNVKTALGHIGLSAE